MGSVLVHTCQGISCPRLAVLQPQKFHAREQQQKSWCCLSLNFFSAVFFFLMVTVLPLWHCLFFTTKSESVLSIVMDFHSSYIQLWKPHKSVDACWVAHRIQLFPAPSRIFVPNHFSSNLKDSEIAEPRPHFGFSKEREIFVAKNRKTSDHKTEIAEKMMWTARLSAATCMSATLLTDSALTPRKDFSYFWTGPKQMSSGSWLENLRVQAIFKKQLHIPKETNMRRLSSVNRACMTKEYAGGPCKWDQTSTKLRARSFRQNEYVTHLAQIVPAGYK